MIRETTLPPATPAESWLSRRTRAPRHGADCYPRWKGGFHSRPPTPKHGSLVSQSSCLPMEPQRKEPEPLLSVDHVPTCLLRLAATSVSHRRDRSATRTTSAVADPRLSFSQTLDKRHLSLQGGQIAEWIPIISSAVGVHMEMLDHAPSLLLHPVSQGCWKHGIRTRTPLVNR